MKKRNVRLASLTLFFASGAVIGMEHQPKVIVQNEAWGYGFAGGYYDIKVSVNDSKDEIQISGGISKVLGNLADINQIKIRRSGTGSSWIPSALGVSTITPQQLNAFKQEANDPINLGKNITLIIGATNTGYAIYTHLWGSPVQGAKGKTSTDKHDPWSAFPQAKTAMEKLKVNFFNDREQRSKLVAIARLVLGFDVQDNPDKNTIKKHYYALSRQFHPDKAQDLTASMIFDKFADQAYAIIVRANEILNQ